MMLTEQDQRTAAAIAGDPEALKELLHQEDSDLRAWLEPQIGRRYRSAFDVDDVLQVTYLEAFLDINRFEPRGPRAFQAWLRQIASRNLRDAIKGLTRAKRPTSRRRAGASSDESYAILLNSIQSDGTTPSIGAGHAEARDLIEEALRKLPPDYAEAVRLYDLCELSAEDAAGRMGRSPASVYMLKARGHERLKELLGSSTNFFSKKV